MTIPSTPAYIMPKEPEGHLSILDVLIMPVLTIVFILGMWLLIRHFSNDQEEA